MEASALQAPATLTPTKVGMPMPLLRFRSDEQLVELFRAGHADAFRAIHDRYRSRLFAYTRQMLPGRQDAEDALQDVFVRAYAGLRASDRELALRAWLFRVAHNRCIDELRRPAPPPPEVLSLVRTTVHDPLAEVDLRESLRRLITDIRRLPDQQRSALLMRELGGMTYAELASSLGISIAAVKSLLVRARLSLAQAAEARDTACVLIREELILAHDRGVRPNANARKHMRDCISCKSFRRELRGVTHQLAALAPIGPLGFLAKMLGIGGAGGGAASTATAGGAGAGGGAALLGGGGAAASAGGAIVGANHLATLIVAAVATAGGAVAIQHTIIAPANHHAHALSIHRSHHAAPPPAQPTPGTAYAAADGVQAIANVVDATVSTPPAAATASPGAAPRLLPKPKLRSSKVLGPGAAGIGPATGGASSEARGLPTTATQLSTGNTATGASSTSGSACSTSGSSTSSSSTSSTGTSSSSTSGTGSTSTGTGTGTGTTAASTPGAVQPCGSSGPSSSGTTSSSTNNSTSGSGSSSTANGSGTSTGQGSGTSTGSGSGTTSGSGSTSSSSSSGSSAPSK